jgi:hypothetical protein
LTGIGTSTRTESSVRATAGTPDGRSRSARARYAAGTIFPGLKIFCGSSAFFSARMASSASSPSSAFQIFLLALADAMLTGAGAAHGLGALDQAAHQLLSARQTRSAHLDLDLPADLARWRGHLPWHRAQRRNAARLACRRGAALGSDPDQHKAGRVGACRYRQLVSPHREQPTGNAIAARDLGNVGALFEALHYDPGLLLRRPPAPLALPSDHLDTTIRIAFLPGIKHGICHRLPPSDQLMPGCIADQSRDREVGASCRLRTMSLA